MSISWGPSGETVYDRTYSRTKANGEKETWPETVRRVVAGNLGLVEARHHAPEEADELRRLIESFAILPAGRHLWASGVPGRQFLFNCHVSGWGEKVSDHFRFSFMRLAEGGGVGANYSSDFLVGYGPIQRGIEVHIVCDPDHRDYEDLKAAGLLSDRFCPEHVGRYFEVEDSREGWADALSDLIEAAFERGDTSSVRVYDVSRVRYRGARIKSFGGYASGPQPLSEMLHEVGRVLTREVGYELDPMAAMDIDHAISACVVAGGNRRSARMSILPWQDDAIGEFIYCKSDPSKHWTTNISVEVDDEFFTAYSNPEHPLHERAHSVIRAVAEGMLANGEPGLWNSTLAAEGEVGKIQATNPCGEICLEPWENCNLGHINLDAFAPRKRGDIFNLAGAMEAARRMTRFLIRATFGDVTDPLQREVLNRNRRIGVGLFGVQAALAKMGIRFSEAAENPYFIHILKTLKETIRKEARAYAFQLRIPEPVKVTTIAPTGTIAKLPGTTEGIHPIYARYFIRRIRFSTVDPAQKAQLDTFQAQGYHVEEDHNAANTLIVEFPTKEKLVEEVEALGYPEDIVESSDEISLDAMLSFQRTVQRYYADNAVSFTANLPDGAYTVDELVDLLVKHLPHLKGTTIFPDKSRPQSPYERITREQYEEMTGPKDISDSIDEDCASGACPIR